MNWIIVILLVLLLPNIFLLIMFPSRKPLHHEHYDVCIVLGSPAKDDGSCSRMQKSRMDRAIELYHGNKVHSIIISGGSVCNAFKEAEVMKQYALSCSIPEEHVIIEEKAKNTYDNLYFAQTICKQQGFHKVIVVTSNFHVRRASFFVHKFFKDYAMAGTREPENLRHYLSEYFRMWNTLYFEYFKR